MHATLSVTICPSPTLTSDYLASEYSTLLVNTFLAIPVAVFTELVVYRTWTSLFVFHTRHTVSFWFLTVVDE